MKRLFLCLLFLVLLWGLPTFVGVVIGYQANSYWLSAGSGVTVTLGLWLTIGYLMDNP